MRHIIAVYKTPKSRIISFEDRQNRLSHLTQDFDMKIVRYHTGVAFPTEIS